MAELPMLVAPEMIERTYTSPEFARCIGLALASQGYKTVRDGKVMISNAPALVHEAAVQFVKKAHP